MPLSENDLDVLKRALDMHVEEISRKLKQSTSEFARQKVGELQQTIIAAKEAAALRHQEALTRAETYRSTSDFLADQAIEFAHTQYESSISAYQRLLDAFTQSVQQYI